MLYLRIVDEKGKVLEPDRSAQGVPKADPCAQKGRGRVMIHILHKWSTWEVISARFRLKIRHCTKCGKKQKKNF